jgi:hypothetical protein
MQTTLKRLYQGSPVVVSAPLQGVSPLTNTTTGGTLAAGTVVSYRITALVGSAETLPSAAVSMTVPAGTNTNSVAVTWSLVPGATGYKVYGRTAGAEQLLATVAANVYFYTDTGSVTPSGALPTSTTLVESTASPGLYVVPAGKSALIKGVTASNPTNIPGQLFLSVVSVGATGGVSTRIVGGALVSPDAWGKAPLNISTFQPLAAGEFITGYVSVPGIIITVSGVELT